MLDLAHRWWVLTLRGVFALLFGILFLLWPAASLGLLVLFFGAWALVDGVIALASAISGRRAWYAAVEGVFGIAIGVITFVWPAITAIALFILIAAWAIGGGILRVVSAVALRKEMEGEIWLGLGGVASVVFGFLMLALPAAGIQVLGWLIGVYAVVIGVLLIALSLRVRALTRAAGAVAHHDEA